jgi:hypothetical protein
VTPRDKLVIVPPVQNYRPRGEAISLKKYLEKKLYYNYVFIKKLAPPQYAKRQLPNDKEPEKSLGTLVGAGGVLDWDSGVCSVRLVS